MNSNFPFTALIAWKKQNIIFFLSWGECFAIMVVFPFLILYFIILLHFMTQGTFTSPLSTWCTGGMFISYHNYFICDIVTSLNWKTKYWKNFTVYFITHNVFEHIHLSCMCVCVCVCCCMLQPYLTRQAGRLFFLQCIKISKLSCVNVCSKMLKFPYLPAKSKYGDIWY